MDWSRCERLVLQELMAMREDKCELRAKIYLLERERENQELKLATLNSQQQAHQATIQHLQTQLCDTDTQVTVVCKIKMKY